MEYFYADSNNKPVGPLNKEQMEGLWQGNIINAETHIIAKGEDTWKRYADYFGEKEEHSAHALPPDKITISKEAENIAACAHIVESEFDIYAEVDLPLFLNESTDNFMSASLLNAEITLIKNKAHLRFPAPRKQDEGVARDLHEHGVNVPNTVILYVETTRPEWCNWRTATLAGGVDLDLNEVHHEIGSSVNILEEHITIVIPIETLEDHLNDGLKIRIRGTSELIIDVPPSHVQATMYLLRKDKYIVDQSQSTKHETVANKSEVDVSFSLKEVLVGFGGAIGVFIFLILLLDMDVNKAVYISMIPFLVINIVMRIKKSVN